MNKVKYNSDLLKLINHFELVTGAKVKDCIANSRLIFIIEENDMGKAIGKDGIKIKKLEFSLKKRIKLVEFTNDPIQFVKNMISPIEVNEIKHDDGVISLILKDRNAKAMLIGREHQNINSVRDIIKRHFPIKEIRVL